MMVAKGKTDEDKKKNHPMKENHFDKFIFFNFILWNGATTT